MNARVKNVLLQVASGSVTGCLCLGSWGLGLFLSFNEYIGIYRSVWTAVCVICAAIILVFAIINIVKANTIYKKISAMKMREIYDWSENLKSDVESDYKRAEKGVRSTLALAYCYIIVVILLMMMCCFGTGVLLHSEEDMGCAIFVIILIVFVMWGLTHVFFTPIADPAPPAAYLLDEKKFPLIYSTVCEAAAKSGCRLKILIYNFGEGASVAVYKHTAIICLNCLYGALLTRNELYNVMLHEFAHIINEDVYRNRTFVRAEQRFDDNGDNVIITFGRITLLPLVSAVVVFKTNFYNLFASRYHEIEADKALKALGNPQESINALAKTKMIEIFDSVPHRELDYDFFAPEKPTGDYIAQATALFLKQRQVHGEEWQTLIERELPARIDSHPTFRNRMAALECDVYDAFCEETDPAYVAEQHEMIAEADRVINAENTNNYSVMRKSAYLERKKIIDEYFETVKNGGEIADNKLYGYIQAFFGIDDDIALELADMATALPNPNVANYYKANILFNRNDDACIGYFRAVAASTDNMELALAAADRLGMYALKTGNEELLKEYRSTMPEIVQASQDKGERNRFGKNSCVTECDLSGEVIKGVIDGIDDGILSGITEIYIGAYVDADGAKHYPVAIALKKRSSVKKNYEVLQGVYDYLYGYNGKYDFILTPPNSPVYRKVKKCGKCVYGSKK